MFRLTVGAVVLLSTWWASPAFAAGWSFAIDLPVSYEFNDIHAVKQDTTQANGNGGCDNGGPLLWKDQNASGLDGFIVTVVSPLHIGPVNFGLGYENYTVKGIIPVRASGGGSGGSGCGPTVVFDVGVKSKFEIFDLVLDIPTELFNIGLGYGTGTAKTTLVADASQIPTIPDADINQYFLTLGVPIKRFDIHISWRWVNVDEVTLQQDKSSNNNNTTTQKIVLSGQLFTAGVRYNF